MKILIFFLIISLVILTSCGTSKVCTKNIESNSSLSGLESSNNTTAFKKVIINRN